MEICCDHAVVYTVSRDVLSRLLACILSDERTCPPNTFTCQSNKDQNTYPCIDMSRVCDGIRNCHGGEDEQQTCPPRTCQPHQFQCNNGICISARFKCDHDNDCGDNSDEPSDCSQLNLMPKGTLVETHHGPFNRSGMTFILTAIFQWIYGLVCSNSAF